MRLIDADALLEELNAAWEDNVLSTLGDVVSIITNAPTIQREGWVSVEDRLPEQFISVLAYFPDCPSGIHQAVVGINADGYWQSEGDYFEFRHEVTHWQPLQPAPTDTE